MGKNKRHRAPRNRLKKAVNEAPPLSSNWIHLAESLLRWLVDDIFRSPLFAAMLALVLAALAVTDSHAVLEMTTVLAGLISFSGLARADRVSKLPILRRTVILLLSAAVLVFVFYTFGKWAIKRYDLQHVGHLQFQTAAGLPLVAGQQTGLNIVYENVGDEPVQFSGMNKQYVIGVDPTRLPVSIDALVMKETWDLLDSDSVPVLNVPPHSVRWMTLKGEPITQDLITEIQEGRAMVLTFGRVRYRNGPTRPDYRYCYLWGKGHAIALCAQHLNS